MDYISYSYVFVIRFPYDCLVCLMVSAVYFMFETPWIVCQIYILFFIAMKHRLKLDFIAAKI